MAPIQTTSYSMAPSEMLELKNQMVKLLKKMYIQHIGLIYEEEGWLIMFMN